MLRKWKLIWIHKYLHLTTLANSWKKICNFYFSDFKRIFSILGGVVTKNAFSKMFPIFKDDFFDTWLTLWQHPQQVFCCFNNIFSRYLEIKLIFQFFGCLYTIHQNLVHFRWKSAEKYLFKLDHFKPCFHNLPIVLVYLQAM